MASIFCDGACRGNGSKHALGGWAWAYWPGAAVGEPSAYRADRLGIPAPGLIPTNQRAELMALLEALRWWRGPGGGGPVTVYTDSMYAINCASKWGPGWKRAAWKRASGEPLQNLDLIKPLVDVWAVGGGKWRLQHVRGHQTGQGPEVHGNNWVDRAAVAGSMGQGGRPMTATVTATVSQTDIIELVPAEEVHYVPTVELAPSPTTAPSPPKCSPKIARVAGPPKASQVKQADIRSWFGFSG
jgi:ribonuclease HI